VYPDGRIPVNNCLSDMKVCSLVDWYQRFGDRCCLYC